MTHNKNQIYLLNLLINCKAATSTPYMLPLKGEYNLSFLNFLVIVFCKSVHLLIVNFT